MSTEPSNAIATPNEPKAEDLAVCAAVLRALRAHPELSVAKDPAIASVRAEANRLIAAIQAQVHRDREAASSDVSKTAKKRRREHDRAAVCATGIRRFRLQPSPRSNELQVSNGNGVMTTTLGKPKRCYICKTPYTTLHPFYDALCPTCATENWAKRQQSSDLAGRVAIVTGGRVKIGQRIALRLLRAGAHVIVTTRFPFDAARRYGLEPDFSSFASRLEIHGLDLRSLGMVERFADRIAHAHPHLDVLVNNAAQTVRRPAGYYEHLVEAEVAGPARLPTALKDLVAHADDTPSALLSQVPLLDEDHVKSEDIFPRGALTTDGQQLDRRLRNSWELALGEIERIELLEVHHVNAFAPFILLGRLLPSLCASSHPQRFVVNVSAMEGKFDYAAKLETHPHTNMAKAALNMLTRTSGPALAERGIYMTSVDTGWITNEHAFLIAERMHEQHGFAPPLDEDDGAARVLDPVFGALAGSAPPLHSVFLKDYRPATW